MILFEEWLQPRDTLEKYADILIMVSTKEKMDIFVNTFIEWIPELVNEVL